MATKPFQHLLHDKKHVIHAPEETSKVKVENCIGFVKVPVGIAGPLLVDGPNATNEQVYATLATTEATLVASCARGCKAFNACGGLQFDILGEGGVAGAAGVGSLPCRRRSRVAGRGRPR